MPSSTKVCQHCGIDFTPKHGSTGKYCSRSCAASSNNKKHPKRKKNDPKFVKRAGCLRCGRPVGRKSTKYCSRFCFTEHKFASQVRLFMAGELEGSDSRGELRGMFRKAVLEAAGNRCSRCSWSEVNPASGCVPLTVDHEDGNWSNNYVSNLVVLCPNCHSLTPTFGVLNKTNPNKCKLKRDAGPRTLGQHERYGSRAGLEQQALG